ncbi:helix-turn-helix domain-containing protein [Marinivivus vitaminiproducens]|uniref:helix-turn-helix domain-containing protein n=1 Tax=Marinivivus vitaminiproducens TaxID=3035935 RepID=UPI0027AAE62F|nr:helix-turn-helix domain-containing protein [Geminicoccaceae bacterium SCSIO 64248]
MGRKAIRFTGLSSRDRADMAPLARLAEGDQLELRIRRHDGEKQTLLLPAAVAGALEGLLSQLISGERVAVVAEDQELSPTEASTLLGISRPLVVHRMDIGDLPFRYVGKHRRVLAKDVLALKARLDVQQQALRALAADAEDLMVNYGA